MLVRCRRLVLLSLSAAAFAAVALAVSACGYTSSSKSVSEGQPVKLGQLQYNVVFSRLLNPNDAEDSAYLAGQPPPPRNGSYFGVFLQVQNEAHSSERLPHSLTITDAGNQLFTAIPSKSLYALPLGGSVAGQDQMPVLDSPPQQGPIEGSLVLFTIPDSASDSRPLTLHIPGQDGPANVKLDL